MGTAATAAPALWMRVNEADMVVQLFSCEQYSAMQHINLIPFTDDAYAFCEYLRYTGNTSRIAINTFP